MAIKSVDASGFVVVTSYRNEVVDESKFSYADHFGCESYTKAELLELAKSMGKDDVRVLIRPDRVEFDFWNFRRSTSENLTNSVALTKGTPVNDAKIAAVQKRDSLMRGEIAAQGGPTLDPFERELKTFAERWLIARGVPTKIAQESSKEIDKAVEYATKMVLDNDTPEERTRIKTLWEKKARQRLDDYQDLPGA